MSIELHLVVTPTVIASLAAAALSACAAVIPSDTVQKESATALPGVSIVTYSSGPAYSVNAHLVVSTEGLVLVDAMRTGPDIEPVIEDIRQRGGKLEAVLLTHTHPDHIGGLEKLIAAFPDAEIYASEITATNIRDDRTGMIASGKRFLAGFGGNVPAPTRITGNGETFRVAGVDFVAGILGPGEAESMTIYHMPALNAVAVGDLVGAGMTPWLVEGRSGPWLAQLNAAAVDFDPDLLLLPGHGPSGPAGTLLADQARYIADLRTMTRDAVSDGSLDRDENRTIRDALDARYPFTDQVAPLPDLKSENLDAVAAELVAAGETP